MGDLNVTVKAIDQSALNNEIKELIRNAYNQGVSDCQVAMMTIEESDIDANTDFLKKFEGELMRLYIDVEVDSE